MRVWGFPVTEVLGGIVAVGVVGLVVPSPVAITPISIVFGFVVFTSGMAAVRTFRWRRLNKNTGPFSKHASRPITPVDNAPVAVTQSQSRTIVHRASWHGNSATFRITPEGVSWSLSDSERSYMLDGVNVEAALAQLERAYHKNVSFPEAERRIMAVVRALAKTHDPEHQIPEDATPGFDWVPPLPTEQRGA